MRWMAVALLFFQAVDYNAEGNKALEEGKYDAAAAAFAKAVQADPKDYSAHFNLALAYGFLRRDAEGVAEYRKALELKPGLYEAQLNAGLLLLRENQPAEALPLLSAAAEQRRAEFQPRYSLAQSQMETGALEEAEHSFARAIEIDPKSAPAESGMAQALAREGKLQDAEAHFRRAAALDERYKDSLLQLARLYEESQRPAEAMAIYREFPDNPAAQKRLGEMMLENRQYADALPRLEASYAKEPTAANGSALAAAYVFTGQVARALPLLRDGVAAQPRDYDLHMMYARALRDSKQFTAAAAQFSEAAKLKPADPKTWNELGGMLYMTGDLAGALSAFDRARDLGDNTPGNWFLRAIILDKLKQFKPALDAYSRFLSVSRGEHPDQEFQARQRVRIIQRELEKR